MKGPHDDKLQQSGYWPLSGVFSIILLDQCLRNCYGDQTIVHQKVLKSDIKNCRVTHSGIVKIEDLSIHQFANNRQPINFDRLSTDGNMYFKVKYHKENKNLNKFSVIHTLNEKLINQKLSLQDALKPLNYFTEKAADPVAPYILKLSGFSEMEIGDPWYSSPFFAFEGGYQICLKVVKERNCLISSELFLMKGPHDEILQRVGLWPLKGTFTVKLLGNNKYYPSSVLLDKEICTLCFKQVDENDIASEGFGFSVFILDSFCTKQDFFKGDALFFEISYNSYTSYYSAS